MKRLTISSSLKLYKVLYPYLSELSENDTLINFIGKIVDSIKDSGNPKDYITAVSILSGISEADLMKAAYDDILRLFVDGITENKVFLLKQFYTAIGYKNANHR